MEPIVETIKGIRLSVRLNKSTAKKKKIVRN